MAPWPSGKAKVCNTSIPSSILGGASKTKTPAQSGGGFRFVRATHAIEMTPHATGVAESSSHLPRRARQACL